MLTVTEYHWLTIEVVIQCWVEVNLQNMLAITCKIFAILMPFFSH